MANLTGLFRRGGSYYIRIVLPEGHPLHAKYRSGRVIQSLGACGHRDAVNRGTVCRAQILAGFVVQACQLAVQKPEIPAPVIEELIRLRDVYNRWVKSQPLTADSIACCGRALKLFEEQTKNTPLQHLTRAQGDAFRAWLQTLPTTSKTARDRMNWVKSMLKYAAQELEVIPKSPWVGLDIKSKTTAKRQPWSTEHLQTLLAHEIWQHGKLPEDTKAGGRAAYWIPLLAMYTGARCSELCQLNVSDIDLAGNTPTINITDEGEGQHVKSAAGHRVLPIHSELLRLGFLDYVRASEGKSLWPDLPQREGKPGGYFSQYFGTLRKFLGIPIHTVFHSFRHSVRTALTESSVPETTIDRILGHESGGSVGARVYTHVAMESLKLAIETLRYPAQNLTRLCLQGGSGDR